MLPIYIASQGFSRSTYRANIHAQERFGGLPALDLHIHYKCQETKWLLYHLRKQDTTEKLEAITIQTHQLEVGKIDVNL